MCLEQCLAVGASQKLLYSRLFFTHCHSLTALGWQNVQQVLPPMEALLTSASFRRPCMPSLLQHLSHPPGPASFPLC